MRMTIVAIILSALSLFGADDKAEARRERRAKAHARIAAMSPEERAAHLKTVKENREKARRERAESLARQFADAKAACTNCYRVVMVEGKCKGFTKEAYEAFQKENEKKNIHAKRHPVSRSRRRIDPERLKMIRARRQKVTRPHASHIK